MTLTKARIVEACACLAKGHRSFPLKFEIESWPFENVRRPADITSRAFLEFPCACEDCLQNLRGIWAHNGAALSIVSGPPCGSGTM